MSTAIASAQIKIPSVPSIPIYRITVRQYHDMIRNGILTENDSVELLEGWIVPKMVRSPGHDTAIDLAEAALRPALPTGWRIRVQNAITTIDSEPEPDVAVVRGDLRAFATQHPGPDAIGLIIESSESSLDIDQVDKGRIYARANISTYWIINLIDRHIEVYTDPDPSANPPVYRSSQSLTPGQWIPFMLEGREIARIAVNDLLP